MSPLGTECLDIFSPPPGAREVMTQVERLSSRDTKIALRSVRIAACSCGRGKRACMVAPAWVVQHPHSAREPGATNRTHGISNRDVVGEAVQAVHLATELVATAWRNRSQGARTTPPKAISARSRTSRVGADGSGNHRQAIGYR